MNFQREGADLSKCGGGEVRGCEGPRRPLGLEEEEGVHIGREGRVVSIFRAPLTVGSVSVPVCAPGKRSLIPQPLSKKRASVLSREALSARGRIR